jgi:hypothetical protein
VHQSRDNLISQWGEGGSVSTHPVAVTEEAEAGEHSTGEFIGG